MRTKNKAVIASQRTLLEEERVDHRYGGLLYIPADTRTGRKWYMIIKRNILYRMHHTLLLCLGKEGETITVYHYLLPC